MYNLILKLALDFYQTSEPGYIAGRTTSGIFHFSRRKDHGRYDGSIGNGVMVARTSPCRYDRPTVPRGTLSNWLDLRFVRSGKRA